MELISIAFRAHQTKNNTYSNIWGLMLRWICYLPTRSNLGNLTYFNCAMEPGVVAHTFNLITQEAEAEAEGLQRVQGQTNTYTASSRTARSVQWVCLKNQTKMKSMRWNKFPSKTLLKTYLCKPKKLNYCSKTEQKQWMTFSRSKILGECLKLAMQRQSRMNPAFVCFFWHLEGKPSIDRD